jgi:hypothetical protein
MPPELRHLRALLAVADQGSASRAGTTLFGLGGVRGGRSAASFGWAISDRRARAFVALTEQHHMPSVAESLVTQPAVSVAASRRGSSAWARCRSER